MPTPGRRRAVGWRSGTKEESPAPRVGLHLAFGVGLGPAPEGVPVPRPAASAPGDPQPTNAPLQRPRGAVAARAGRVVPPRRERPEPTENRRSRRGAWVGHRRPFPVRAPDRAPETWTRSTTTENRRSRRGAWVGHRRPFPVRAPDSAPETWAWATRSAGGRPRAGPRPRRGPDRVAVANVCGRCGGARVVMVSDLRRGEGMAYILYSTSCTGLAFRAARESSPNSMGRNGLRILPRATGGAGPRGRRGEGGGSCQRARRAATGPSRCGTPPPS